MKQRLMGRSLWQGLLLLSLLLLCWLGSLPAQASPLAERMAQFPDWQTKPPVSPAQGDLLYPSWFNGTWSVTTTLTDLVAPLAPDLVTPGFEGNRQYLDQPVPFTVRFGKPSRPNPLAFLTAIQKDASEVVSDRSFNGLSLSRAYLGDRAVLSVQVDPKNPNRQITKLRGDRQLVSTVTARAVETPDENQFITSELFQQEFRGAPQIYFNTVENTTVYSRHSSQPTITAEQITAIYLSPQDADYFKAGDRPVALYRYHMEFVKD